MLLNPQKAVAVFDFNSLKYEESGRKISTLLELLINEVRADNDTAGYEGVLRNQGEINAYLRLKSYLEKETKESTSIG